MVKPSDLKDLLSSNDYSNFVFASHILYSQDLSNENLHDLLLLNYELNLLLFEFKVIIKNSPLDHIAYRTIINNFNNLKSKIKKLTWNYSHKEIENVKYRILNDRNRNRS